MEKTELTNEDTKCEFCWGTMPSKHAIICIHCNNPQTKAQLWCIKNAAILSALKYIAGAFFIPLFLFLITSYYASIQSELDEISQKHKSILDPLPKITVAIASLYEPCVGSDLTICRNNVDKAYLNYLEAINQFRSAVSINYPELLPTVLLLSVLDQQISYDTNSLWNDYFECIDSKQKSKQECIMARRGRPIMSLVIAHSITEFLECKVNELVSKELNKKLSSYCFRTIKKREKLMLSEPSELMRLYEGNRPPSGLLGISNKIFNELIFPRSGLGPKKNN